MAEINVVVLGAGVIGLTTAMLLAEDPKYSITIVAKHMPGDYDIEYASPWAGANYFPVSKKGTKAHTYDRDTWAPLADLATNHPEAGIHFQDALLYNRAVDVSSASPITLWQRELTRPDPWYASLVPNFRVLDPSTLPSDIASATAFTTVCINTALYLPWLASRCLAAKCTLKRGMVSHISQAPALHSSGRPATIVINCTGLGARTLGGVSDAAVVPARGQIVVVRNDPGVMMGLSGTDDGDDECTYIMHRAAGGGCVLGGCYQKGSTESSPDPNLAVRIMTRCVKLCPALVGGEGKGIEALSIVRHGVGLRPVREGGTRVEAEWVETPADEAGVNGTSSSTSDQKAVVSHLNDVNSTSSNAENSTNGTTNGTSTSTNGTNNGSVTQKKNSSGTWVIHNYGHGGAGYQSSYGTALEAVRLVEGCLGS